MPATVPMQQFSAAAVAAVFKAYPPGLRRRLLFLRGLIFDVAARTPGVGELTETLKWGEPAYLTVQSGSGSTIRIDRKKAHPTQYAMYFHCQTMLVDTFRTLFPTEFRYEANRSILFEEHERVPVKQLRLCIEMALTYHRRKARRG